MRRALLFLKVLKRNQKAYEQATLIAVDYLKYALKPQGPHTMCLCSRLLLYSKCTGFTVCFTYSDISLTMYINQ